MKTRTGQLNGSTPRMLLAVVTVAALAAGMAQPAVATTQIDIVGPPGSSEFGKWVTVLPNGNIVVTDPYYDAGAVQDVGAVYLYDGATGAQISMLTGSTAYDRVGGSPYGDTQPAVTVLSNGNYLVISPWWDNAAGAVTWGSATTGVSGVVSAANSLVSSTAGDWVGYPVTALSNGNYVVCSSLWDNGAAVDAGAVTWGDGTTGVTGVVSAANSLVGSTADDHVGCAGLNCLDAVTELSNGNYVVGSPYWDNDMAADAGAVTWGSGTAGVSGPISPATSLVGSTAGDRVGFLVTALANGNYLVRSPSWDDGPVDDAGAVTWGDGMTGRVGVVSAANSLVGSRAGDQVGNHVIRLSNGSYLVRSPSWDNGLAADAGAVTWGSGTAGVSGIVSAANSLVGSRAHDQVGCADEQCQEGVTELSNGNYVVRSSYWDNAASREAGTTAPPPAPGRQRGGTA